MDGIITNHPERLVALLRESEFSSRFRLADQDDSPWERIQARQDDNPSPAAPVSQPVQLRWAAGMGDMFTSFAKYLRDFVYLRVPSYHSISRRSFEKSATSLVHSESEPKESPAANATMS